MLKELLDSGEFYTKLKRDDIVYPLPKASDREVWGCLKTEIREKYIKKAEEFLAYEYPSLLTTRYMDFIRNGNRSRYEKTYVNRRLVLAHLVIGECLEHKGRFLDDIINGILLICEETSWVAPAHNNDIIMGYSDSIHIDIFSAETGALLSYIYYMMETELSGVSPLIAYRIRSEIENRILKPYMENDFWWMSFGSKKPSIWNAWCNVNCLAAFLIIEEDKDSLQKAVSKIINSLDVFIGAYKKDGGCDDSVSYWEQTAGCLFEAFEFLCCIDEKVADIFNDEKIKNIVNFPIKANIDEDKYFNFADSSARVEFNIGLLYRAGNRINDNSLVQFSKYLYNVHKNSDLVKIYFEGRSLYRQVMDLFADDIMLSEDTNVSVKKIRDAYFKGTEAIIARESEDSSGLYLAAKGRSRLENYNHNDVGSFIVYKNSQPFLIDVGIEVYKRETFSEKRFEIWTMQSQYHNLPTFSGAMQKFGSLFKSKNVSYDCTDDRVTFSLDIEDAYGDFNIKKVSRLFDFYRGGNAYIEITDEYELSSHDGDTFYYFMCSQEPALVEPGNIEILSGGSKINIYYDAKQFDFAYEAIELDDLRLTPVWGTRIYRVILSLLHKDLSGRICFKIQ